MLNMWHVAWAAVLAVLGGGAIWAAHTKMKGAGTPTRWPVVGMMPAILMNLGNVYDWATTILLKNGGSFQFYGPNFSDLNYFVTADPRNVEFFLNHNFSNYPKGRHVTDIFADLLGHGIFNADGDTWRTQRNSASLHINSPAYRRYADAVVISAVNDRLLPVLREICARGRDVDLQDLMMRFTFDVTCRVAFGVDTGILAADLPELLLARSFEHALECTTARFYLPTTWWKMIRWLGVGKEGGMPAALKVVDRFISDVVAGRRKELTAIDGASDGAAADMDRSDLLSCFMKHGANLSDEFLKDLCRNLLLAGRDALAVQLSWFFWLIATHPEKEARLLEEIDATLAAANGVFSPQILNQMTYLHVALSESLRLYPAAPADVRHVLRDDVMPDGHRVYKDHKVIQCTYTMGRMQSIWGADCLEFRPERWFHAGNRGRVVHVSPYQYPVFSAGPRTCLGKEMALLVTKAVACAVLHNFKIVLVPGHVVEPKVSITMHMKRGLLVCLEPRVSKS